MLDILDVMMSCAAFNSSSLVAFGSQPDVKACVWFHLYPVGALTPQWSSSGCLVVLALIDLLLLCGAVKELLVLAFFDIVTCTDFHQVLWD